MYKKLRVLASLAIVVLLSGYGEKGTAAVNAPPSSAPYASSYPIQSGQVGPIDPKNPRQQPFACTTPQMPKNLLPALGQPVDADCGIPMRVDYFYRKVGDKDGTDLSPYDAKNPPSDVAKIKLPNGNNVPFIVRFERGTINRFLYSIALLTPRPDRDNPDAIDLSAWNKDLVFSFAGGTGVGHTQSHIGNATAGIINPNSGGDMMPYLLQQGYAVAFSTGTATSTTYNLMLTGQTASMLKQQFTAAYGKPRYTFAVGASGGAVQQQVYAQNLPGLLDAAVLIQNFPDMVTQIPPIGDCELLHYYFDQVDAQVNGSQPPAVNDKWKSWAKRALIVGLNGIDGYPDPTELIIPGTSTAGKGSDVCMQEWRGSVPMFFSPYWGMTNYSDDSLKILGPQGLASTYWGYFNDLVTVFSALPNAQPYPSTPITYDNEGVQYGLAALNAGQITPDEFLTLNAHVGGWKYAQDFQQTEGFPFGPKSAGIDPWSSRDATAKDHMKANDIAPRTVAIPPVMSAIQHAYKAGLVFLGKVNTPFIHIQPYLEPALNEHASREPFATRQRLIEANGNHDNQVIWMTPNGDNPSLARFVLQALSDETTWLQSGTRPASLQDACYDQSNNLIASGPDVWDGQVSADGSQVLADTAKGGACTKHYPIHPDARIVSGAPVSGHVFKCALKPVTQALSDGTYADKAFFADPQRSQRLSQIFSTGVCDYSKPDQAMPAELRIGTR